MAELIRFVGGRLRVEGVEAGRIAAEAGTPTYAYSAGEIRRRFRDFDRAFAGQDHLLCYALKANSNLSLCRLLAKEGAGADIVSGGELRRALEAGIPPSKIVFSGVGKLDSELEAALRAGILAVNVESGEEARRLELAARRLGRRAPFAVRLNPGVDARTHPHVTTGVAGTKFGLSRRETLGIYRRARAGRWLEAVGIQCHIGSQISSLAPYRAALKGLLGTAEAVAAMGLRLRHADIGGGMGIVYDRGRAFPPRELAKALLPALRGRGLRLLLEPGRCLVGPAGLLLTRALYRKRSGGRRFVVVDAAMNDLIRPALYGATHPVVCVRPRAGRNVPVDVVGPVCETADFFARGRRLPPVEPGDLLAVLKAGAYGFSMSSQYNSRPRAAEVLVEGRRFKTIRARETFSDLVRHER